MVPPLATHFWGWIYHQSFDLVCSLCLVCFHNLCFLAPNPQCSGVEIVPTFKISFVSPKRDYEIPQYKFRIQPQQKGCCPQPEIKRQNGSTQFTSFLPWILMPAFKVKQMGTRFKLMGKTELYQGHFKNGSYGFAFLPYLYMVLSWPETLYSFSLPSFHQWLGG